MLQKKSQDMRLQEIHGLQNSSWGGGGRKPYLATGLYTHSPETSYRLYTFFSICVSLLQTKIGCENVSARIYCFDMNCFSISPGLVNA